MGLTREYYYHKHEFEEAWTDEEPDPEDEVLDQRTITTDEISFQPASGRFTVYAEGSPEDWAYRLDPDKYALGYQLEAVASYGPFTDYRLALEGDPPTLVGRSSVDPPSVNFDYGEYVPGTLYEYRNSPDPVYKIDGDGLIECSIYWYFLWDTRPESSFIRLAFDFMTLEREARMVLDTEKEIWQYQSIGERIETIIAEDGEYPDDGEQDGFWWYRGDEYTLEPPELLYPEPTVEKQDEVGEFRFRIVPRVTYNPGNYHARLRVGPRSDFQRRLFFADTSVSTEHWEYYDGAEWQDFPSDGVDEDTEVRYTVPGDVEWDFGMYFWDAQAYHSFWGYGPAADFRSIILLTDTDEVYKLYIAGIPYRIVGLQVTESSNGQVGRIDARLVNEL